MFTPLPSFKTEKKNKKKSHLFFSRKSGSAALGELDGHTSSRRRRGPHVVRRRRRLPLGWRGWGGAPGHRGRLRLRQAPPPPRLDLPVPFIPPPLQPKPCFRRIQPKPGFRRIDAVVGAHAPLLPRCGPPLLCYPLSHSWHRGIEQPSRFLKMGARTPPMRGDASRLESLGAYKLLPLPKGFGWLHHTGYQRRRFLGARVASLVRKKLQFFSTYNGYSPVRFYVTTFVKTQSFIDLSWFNSSVGISDTML